MEERRENKIEKFSLATMNPNVFLSLYFLFFVFPPLLRNSYILKEIKSSELVSLIDNQLRLIK